MNLLPFISNISLIIISLALCFKLFLFKKEIKNIINQVEDFRLRRTNKIINTKISDKDMEKLSFEINEYLELYKKNEQEKINFENTLKQGIANMSHDLRTPLTSIIGYIKLLENDDINREEAVKIIKDKAQKLNILINDFFELASIESKEYKLEITKINLSNILNDEILSFYQSFEDKDMKPLIEISTKPIFINGNKESLERIIDNLIYNTLKYAEKDIKICLNERDNKIILTISNKCTNICEGDVLHMFDRFYMADKTRKGQGTGLGLSIAKALMEKMNGLIISKYENSIISIICQWKRSY
ncbi:sensor histidine kinase [Clostridium beijerinckii]|uniref:histidine kinase n=1 Tax=Clostridium beijerinckii TaxID=1520 RepID=A0A7X9SSF1_CLOBE|nr:HAMP domain-containing sensor histidine kinase [Clostridium beijerinckii]NMF07206.1 HAMP domain-containing histidine kinase [Clostridium beijerinckii]